MDAERWERIKSIGFAALDRTESDRTAFLDQACAGDAELRREVESILAEFDAEPEFLETPLVRISGSASAEQSEEVASPTYVGPYRLIRLLGRGGMGEVSLAVREEEGFRRSVAVKVIRRGLDTDEVLQRFRLERQILASLSHPNIAQLLDGGATEDGRPYFVMEYIEGLPLDTYCDREKLSIRERLDLFQVICQAVQHAHQNLVIHRDLKPRNIIVTADGAPKLLDFGIGKVLAPGPSLGAVVETRTDVRVLTPEYAAPEQVRGDPVTTATDVYGLGVLLYEMLTGHHPHSSGRQSLQDIEKAVCDEDPSRPSAIVSRTESRPHPDGSTETISPQDVSARRRTDPGHLRRRLSGDLDNIVLKALRKEPARRYSSPTELAEDIRRHLTGLPVRARPDALGYRAGKFLKRHAWAVTAAAAVFVALLVSTGVTLVQSQRVARERDNALEERDKAVEVRGFLMEMFGATSADQSADTLTARQLLDLQGRRIGETFADQPELRAEMMDVLADGYDRLGLTREAEPWARTALDLRRKTLGEDHPDVAASLNTLGWILHELGRSDEAEPLLQEAVAIRRDAGAGYRVVLSRSLNDLGIVVEELGNLEDAETMYREALDIRMAELGPTHRSVGITANNLAVGLFRQGDFAGAAQYGTQALEALRASVGADHQRSIIAQSNLAFYQRRSGDLESAEDVFRDLLERQTRLQGREHPITAMAINNLAGVLSDAGRHEEAERTYREVVAVREATLDPMHPDVATSLSGLAYVLMTRGTYPEAEEAYKRALNIYAERFGESHRLYGRVLADLGILYERMGRPVQSLEHSRRALTVWDEAYGPDHPSTATLRARVARVLLDSDEPVAALGEFQEAHRAALTGLPTRFVHSTRLGLAEAHLRLDHYEIADSLVAVSRPGIENGEGNRELEEQLKRLLNSLPPSRP